jgi:hypothetical protein
LQAVLLQRFFSIFDAKRRQIEQRFTAVQNSVSWTGEAPVSLVNSGYISHFPKPVGHPAVRMLSKSSTS